MIRYLTKLLKKYTKPRALTASANGEQNIFFIENNLESNTNYALQALDESYFTIQAIKLRKTLKFWIYSCN